MLVTTNAESARSNTPNRLQWSKKSPPPHHCQQALMHAFWPESWRLANIRSFWPQRCGKVILLAGRCGDVILSADRQYPLVPNVHHWHHKAVNILMSGCDCTSFGLSYYGSVRSLLRKTVTAPNTKEKALRKNHIVLMRAPPQHPLHQMNCTVELQKPTAPTPYIAR